MPAPTTAPASTITELRNLLEQIRSCRQMAKTLQGQFGIYDGPLPPQEIKKTEPETINSLLSEITEEVSETAKRLSDLCGRIGV